MDFERTLRLEWKKNLSQYKNNSFQFIVWRDSLFYRFLISSTVLIFLAMFIQQLGIAYIEGMNEVTRQFYETLEEIGKTEE